MNWTVYQKLVISERVCWGRCVWRWKTRNSPRNQAKHHWRHPPALIVLRRIFKVFYLQNSHDQEETGWLIRKRLLDKLERQLTVRREHKRKHVRVGNPMCGCQNNAMDRNISDTPRWARKVGEWDPHLDRSIGNEPSLASMDYDDDMPMWKKRPKYTRFKSTSGSYEVSGGIKSDVARRNSSRWDAGGAGPGSPPQRLVPPSWDLRFTWHTQNIWKKD